MARTQSISIPPGQEQLQRRALEERDRFTLGVVQAHKRIPPLGMKRRLRAQSIFRILSPFWRSLSDAEKQSWRSSGAVSGLTNWQAFISENAGARRIGETLPVTPSNFHTGNVGSVISSGSSAHFSAVQYHPQKYMVARPLPGRRWKSELTTITEPFALPLALRIRYRFTSTQAGDNPVARYSARVTTSYQGNDIVRDYGINFISGDSWREVALSITGQLGYIVGYELRLEISGQSFTLYFDNIVAQHSGTNWARDPKCNRVDRRFTKAFSLVSPYWNIEISEQISSFSSGYFAFNS